MRWSCEIEFVLEIPDDEGCGVMEIKYGDVIEAEGPEEALKIIMKTIPSMFSVSVRVSSIEAIHIREPQ